MTSASNLSLLVIASSSSPTWWTFLNSRAEVAYLLVEVGSPKVLHCLGDKCGCCSGIHRDAVFEEGDMAGVVKMGMG